MIDFHNLYINSFKDFSIEGWNELLKGFDATVNYTSWFINYIEVLNVNTSINNLTFTVFRGNVAIAIVPLYVEKINNDWQISAGQEPVYAPIFSLDVLSEDILHDGQPHPAHRSYAYSKRMVDIQIEAYNKQNGLNYCSVIPGNIFGIFGELNETMSND